MLYKLIEWRRKLAGRDISLWEVLPIFVAIVLPSIVGPEWLWRLIGYFVASLTIFLIFVHGLLVPEQVKKFANIRSLRVKKYMFLLVYFAGLFGVCFILFYSLIPSGGDLYRIIEDPNALEQKTITVTDWNSGGAAPFFLLQTFTSGTDRYSIPFSFTAWGIGTFEILYSPDTHIIYEMQRK